MINIQLGDILQSVRDGNIFLPVAPFYRLLWSTFFDSAQTKRNVTPEHYHLYAATPPEF